MRIGVLGPLEVRRDARAVGLGSEKQRRLLTALVAGGGVVPVDRLVEVLWGDDAPPSALRSLRTYVYRLRATLQDAGLGDLVTTVPPGYALAVPVDGLVIVDAHRFEQLVVRARAPGTEAAEQVAMLDEALGLWRGPAYVEFADEEFVRGEATRLDELRRSAVEERAAALVSMGRHGEVIGELEAFVAEHPYRERARELLMRALYCDGRQPDALAVFRSYQEVLRDELGLEPSASIAALEVDILRQAPHLEAPHLEPDTEPAMTDTPRLPPERHRLIGRAADVDALGRQLEAPGTVTVTGTGGVGKSRLALRLAHLAAGAGRTVLWCELAPVARPEEVAHAMATTVGARAGDGATVEDALVDALAPQRALVVIDNCEHVTDAVAGLVERITASCPDVAVLATSRSPLGAAGERLHPLAPLEPPSAALELFLERAVAARPDLDDSAEERACLLEVCRRLDGLPLALELAASRMRMLNPTDLLDRLDDRLDLVVDRRDAGGRHGGLRAVLDWSYGLLGRTERRLFARLSVFTGSFDLPAAEAVTSGDGIAPGEVVDLLGGLVDQSLVSVMSGGGAARVRLLETLRLYGWEQACAAGEAEPLGHRHAAHYVAVAEAAAALVQGPEEAAGSAQLAREGHQLRSAHRWAVEHGEVDLALRLSAATFRDALWRLRDERFRWAEEAAALPGAADHEAYPTVAGMVGWGAGLRGDMDTADQWAHRGLAAVDGPDDPRGLVPLEVLMHTALWQGRLEECLDVAARAAPLTRGPDELVPHYVPCLALTYAGRPEEALERIGPVQRQATRSGNPTMLALVHYAEGEALLEVDPARAGAALECAAAHAASVESPMMQGVIDVSLISLRSRHGGGSGESVRAFLEVIDRLHGAGDWTHLWTGMRGLVGMLVDHGRHQDAAVMLGAVRGAPNAPPVYGEDAERLAALEQRLGDLLGAGDVRAFTARGTAMSDDDAIDFARTAIERCADTVGSSDDGDD